jgi:hypothetical protein
MGIIGMLNKVFKGKRAAGKEIRFKLTMPGSCHKTLRSAVFRKAWSI